MDWTLLKKFKNQFNLAKTAVNELSVKQLRLNLQINPSKDSTISLELPPVNEIARFATVLRPLADPSSPLYFQHITAMLIANEKMPENEKELFRIAVDRLERGPYSIKMNQKAWTATELYEAYSKGVFFDKEVSATKKIKDFGKFSVMPALLQFQFYYYNYEVYKICSYLYQLIRRAEKEKKEVKSKAGAVHRCLYCLSENSAFTSEEHVFPESLGNTEIILEPGHVCDKCNNGLLHELDDYLVNHDLISFLRTLYLPYKPKSGRFPFARYQNLTVEKTQPLNVIIKPQAGPKSGIFTEDLGEGAVRLRMRTTGRKPFDPIHLGRAIFKIALGFLCWKSGPEIAFSSKYDVARQYVLGKKKYPNNLFISGNCEPLGEVSGEYFFTQTGTPFAISIFGIVFLSNLETEPCIQMNNELRKLEMQCFALF